MGNSYRRHELTDAMWELLKPYTIGNKGTWGGNAKDTRQFLNGVFWILRTGAPWRDLPPEYGHWNTVQRRFCRWKALAAGMQVVIPPRKNRKDPRDYDRYLYKLRHLVENAFLHLKRWRGVATRYAKHTSSFVAAVQIRCIVLWAAIHI